MKWQDKADLCIINDIHRNAKIVGLDSCQQYNKCGPSLTYDLE